MQFSTIHSNHRALKFTHTCTYTKINGRRAIEEQYILLHVQLQAYSLLPSSQTHLHIRHVALSSCSGIVHILLTYLDSVSFINNITTIMDSVKLIAKLFAMDGLLHFP